MTLARLRRVVRMQPRARTLRDLTDEELRLAVRENLTVIAGTGGAMGAQALAVIEAMDAGDDAAFAAADAALDAELKALVAA